VDSFSRWPGLRGITDAQARAAFVANRDQNMFYGIYDRWEAAEAAAPPTARVVMTIRNRPTCTAS
jgi:hypothetical protein